MAHDDLQRLSLRLGVVGAMTAQAKETAGRLSSGADEYERALLKRTNTLARQIRREGVGKNPKLEREYCELLMQRRRMLQSYELAKQDAAKSPDVTATKSLRKSLQPVPFEALPTIYLIASSPAARQLAVSLSSSGIEALATSDIESAVETAAILHEVFGVPVAAPQPGFRAWDLGTLVGLPDKDTGPFVRSYVEDHPDAAPPGGESFNAYHERFMTSLTPMLILVGRGVRRAIGIVTDTRNLLLAQAWLHSGGKLGDLNLEYFVGRVLDPGTVLRMTLTAEGWEGTLFPPVPEHQGEGLFITALPPDMTLMKGRAGKGTQPGQLGFSFDEEAHPREKAGEHDRKYRGGEFVPKDQGAAEGDETADLAEDWKKNGIHSQAFKAWFGDWENNPKMASKVVDTEGEPQETHEVEGSQVVDDLGRAKTVYHGTNRGGFTEFSKEKQDPKSLYGPGFYFTEDESIAKSYLTKDPPIMNLSRELMEEDVATTKDMTNAYLSKADGYERTAALNIWGAADQGPKVLADMLGRASSAIGVRVRRRLKVEPKVASRPTIYALYLNIRNPFRIDQPLPHGFIERLAEQYPQGDHTRQGLEHQRRTHDPDERESQLVRYTWMGTNGKQQFGRLSRNEHAELSQKYIMTEAPLEPKSHIDLTGEQLLAHYPMGETRNAVIEGLKRMGFDGLTHIGGNIAGGGQHLHRVWIAFEPEQIKSADNEGTFDPTSPDIRKSVNGGPFVPPDMPRWQQQPDGDEQRFLPLNGVEDRDKLRGMIETMREGKWTWDKPIVNSGDQLLTGSHRYHAAKEAGLAIPLKDFGAVCAEGGVDFEAEWRERAEPYGGWISNVSNVIRLLPPGLAEKYGIELG